MYRTDGIVNPETEHLDRVARLFGVPREFVDDAQEVFDSLNADAHTLALTVNRWDVPHTIREVSGHEVEIIGAPPTAMHPMERDAALARYVTDARDRLRRTCSDFDPPPRTGVGSEDAALLRDALGRYLLARETGQDSTDLPRATDRSQPRDPEDPLPPVSKAFAAEVLFRTRSVDELTGMMDRNEIAYRKYSRQRVSFDRVDVKTWNRGLDSQRMNELILQHRTAHLNQRRQAAGASPAKFRLRETGT